MSWILACCVGAAVWCCFPARAFVGSRPVRPGGADGLLLRWVRGLRRRWRGSEPPAGDAPVVLELVAVGLEAGLGVRRAVAVVAEVAEGPGAEALARASRRLALGVRPVEAWRPARAALGPAADDCACGESGVALAHTLRERAASLRHDRAREAERRARTAGVRMTLPLTLCFLPAFVLLGVVPLIAGLVGRLW